MYSSLWVQGFSLVTYFIHSVNVCRTSRAALVVKNPSANAREVGSIPGPARSPGGGNVNPLGTLAWKIPCTEEPGGLQSMGWQRVRRD